MHAGIKSIHVTIVIIIIIIIIFIIIIIIIIVSIRSCRKSPTGKWENAPKW